MKRTNVVLDEKKLKDAKKAYDIETTKELLDFALTELLKARDRKDILKLKGKIKIELPIDLAREVS